MTTDTQLLESAPFSNLFLDVLVTLERIGAPYMVVGAFAALLYGVTRNTHDIDVVVELTAQQVAALASAYRPPRYYADLEQMLDSIVHGTLFNIIDTSLGDKADLVPLRHELHQRRAFSRRVRQSLELPDGKILEIWCARPEDIIVGKLAAWAEAGARRHESDILQMLIYSGLETPDEPLPLHEIAAEATRLGPETMQLWAVLQQKADREVADRRRT